MIFSRLLLFLPIVFYFFLSWGIQWPALISGTTISASYLFDLVYAFLILVYFKKLKIELSFNKTSFVVRCSFMVIAALISILLLNTNEIKTPFKYLDHLLIQLIIFAPIMEEIVFRGAFVELIGRLGLKPPISIGLNAAIFSFSHMAGLFVLPEEFHSFIYIQMIYTFFMGWVLTKSRLETKNYLEPIILHFLFNFIFYLAVRFSVI